MDDLIAFLNARMDEDKAIALHAGSCDYYDDIDESVPLADEREHALRHAPARVLDEVKAKREIVKAYEWVAARKADGGGIERDYQFRTGQVNALESAVQSLAAIYSDHPDYRPEWKP